MIAPLRHLLHYRGFNTSYVSVQGQLLLCFFLCHNCFNTSYVSVQESNKDKSPHYPPCFNTSYVSVQALSRTFRDIAQLFQYILCVGSRRVQGTQSRQFLGFNTSYVSVQVFNLFKSDFSIKVSIHPMCRFKICFTALDGVTIRVSIHPMCRFKWHPT